MLTAVVADLFRLDGRVALVTGASSGLGARFASVLHGAGAEVVVTARRKDRLDAVSGGRMTAFAGDLRDATTRAALIDSVAERHGRLDIVVNNAGVCDGGPIEEQTLAQLLEVVELNLVAVLDLCRLAGPLLIGRRGATVVNVSSIYGLVGSREPMAAYNASKGALVNLTRNLAAQWGRHGVRVNALAPGFFPTELTGQLADPGQRAHIERQTLLGRVPDPAELDGPLLFLVSDAASYVTGHVLTVDGGWTAT